MSRHILPRRCSGTCIPLLLLILVPAVLVLLFSFSYELFQYGDNCGYLTLGMSFAQGKGFTDISIPGNPHFLWWPPGFPLFVTLFYTALGAHWVILKLLIFGLLYVGFAGFATIVKKRENDTLKAGAVLLLLSLSAPVHLLSSYLYSEAFFLAVSLFFFVLWHRWRDELNGGKVFLLSFTALYVGAIRNAGIALPLALGIYLLLPRPLNRTTVPRRYGLLPLVLLAAYVWIVMSVPALQVESFQSFFGRGTVPARVLPLGAPSSVSENTGAATSQAVRVLGPAAAKLARSVRGYVLTLVPQTIAQSSYELAPMSKIKAAFMAVLSMIVLIGWLGTWRRYMLLNLYASIYFGVLLLYGPMYVRLLVPLVPAIVLYCYSGLAWLAGRLIPNRKARTAVVAGLWLLLIVDNAAWTFTNPRKYMTVHFGDEKYQQCIEWVIDNANENDVVVSQIHSYMFLRRGKYNIPYHFTSVPNEIITFLDFWDARYLMISPFYQRPRYTYMSTVREAIARYPERFRTVFGDVGESAVVEYVRGQ